MAGPKALSPSYGSTADTASIERDTMPTSQRFLPVVAAVGLMFVAGVAQAQFYIGGNVGAVGASGPELEGHDNDRGGVCDEFINPLFADVPGCTDPRRPGDSWMTEFDRATDVLAGAVVGYKFPMRGARSSRFRLEMEYFHRNSAFDASADVRFGAGASEFAADLAGEVVLAEDRLGSIAGHNLFGNFYIDFTNRSRFTPYMGIGVGVAFTEVGYGAFGLLNNDPARIASAADLPNADEVRRNLAGTVVRERADLKDTVRGYQLLFGVDYALNESMSFGVKGRWVRFDTFSGSGAWDRLRSHASELRLDGSEPVTYEIKLDNLELLGVSLELKYQPSRRD